MTPNTMLAPKVTPTELLAEVLLLRPEIERILADHPGCCNASSIEDRVQIVLLNVVRHLDTYEPHVDGPRPWVWRIAHNVKIDARRSRKRQIVGIGHERLHLHDVPSKDVCTEHRTRARQLLRKVIPVIMEMPEPLRVKARGVVVQLNCGASQCLQDSPCLFVLALQRIKSHLAIRAAQEDRWQSSTIWQRDPA